MNIQTLPDDHFRNTLRRVVYEAIGCCQDVHKEKGPELTEYVYQECLSIALGEAGIPFIKEYRFHPTFRGKELKSELRVDFYVKNLFFIECKAIERIGFHERTQLASYMRNANVSIGILYNFAPLFAQCERLYLDKKTNKLYFF